MHVKDSQLVKLFDNEEGSWQIVAEDVEKYHRAQKKVIDESNFRWTFLGGGVFVLIACLVFVWLGLHVTVLFGVASIVIGLLDSLIVRSKAECLTEYEWMVKEAGRKDAAVNAGLFKELIGERVRIYECTPKSAIGIGNPYTYVIVQLDNDGKPTGKEWSAVVAKRMKLDPIYETPPLPEKKSGN